MREEVIAVTAYIRSIEYEETTPIKNQSTQVHGSSLRRSACAKATWPRWALSSTLNILRGAATGWKKEQRTRNLIYLGYSIDISLCHPLPSPPPPSWPPCPSPILPAEGSHQSSGNIPPPSLFLTHHHHPKTTPGVHLLRARTMSASRNITRKWLENSCRLHYPSVIGWIRRRSRSSANTR